MGSNKTPFQGTLVGLALLCGGACGGGEPDDLSTQQLSMVINGRRPELQQCYETALAKNPSRKEVRMHAAIHIRPSGDVYEVKIDEGSALAGMSDCIQKAILTWRFPKVADETHASLPLIFRPEVEGMTGDEPGEDRGDKPPAGDPGTGDKTAADEGTEKKP